MICQAAYRSNGAKCGRQIWNLIGTPIGALRFRVGAHTHLAHERCGGYARAVLWQQLNVIAMLT